ncbi:MAG: hypothetical protein KGI97_05625 [Alphaproteobacteria bacterium]|nr:hypothetical protein [Alphaproteobacteria bacterium]
MLQKNNLSPLPLLVTIPVVAIIVAALALSGLAAVENWRFMRAADQVLQFVGMVRQNAAVQKGFAVTPGEDVWAALQGLGQIIPPAARLNPWQGGLRAAVVNSRVIRIETDLPTHDCRRLALYFIKREPQETGLLAAEAESGGPGAAWSRFYPSSVSPDEVADAAARACGREADAHLALFFQIR